jgi:signal transduction histidine kinase
MKIYHRAKGLFWEMWTELVILVRQSVADSWLLRVSLATTIVLLLLFIWTRLINLFATKGFGPHGACLLWLPGLITLYVGSDTSIGLSYVSISAMLIYLVYRTRRTIPFHWVFIAFGTFIIACGTTHFLDVFTLWIPAYWLAGTVKLLTAFASVTTAIALPFQIPKILDLVQRAVASEQAHSILRQEAESQNKSLVSMAEELVHTNQTQRQFVATVSHEFRTALMGIQGFSELLCEETYSPEESKEFASNIFGEAVRLERMITALLDLEQMKSGRMSLTLSRVDLNTLIRKVLDHLRLTSLGHDFCLQLDSTLECMGDSDKLEQVMTNLLSNAIKYSPNGGEILVGSRVEQGMVQVWVQDHGTGIPSEFFEEIFVPYSRMGTTRYIKGTGLGLSISRQIIQMHGGHIWVESSLGQGSRFQFAIPLVPALPSR